MPWLWCDDGLGRDLRSWNTAAIYTDPRTRSIWKITVDFSVCHSGKITNDIIEHDSIKHAYKQLDTDRRRISKSNCISYVGVYRVAFMFCYCDGGNDSYVSRVAFVVIVSNV